MKSSFDPRYPHNPTSTNVNQVFLSRSVHTSLFPMAAPMLTLYLASERAWSYAGVVLTWKTAAEAKKFRAEALL